MSESASGGARQTAPLIEMRHIGKTFSGVPALVDVSFSAVAGEIHALMGENGAGKSTLMKILSGVYAADSGGQILIDGKPVSIDNPLSARRNGIAIIHQELALAPNLSVAENIFLGRELRRSGMVDRLAMIAACRPVLERLGVHFGAATKVSTLSIAEQQLVEISRAVMAHARILVMDEPTTSLSSRETERLFALIRQLKSEGMAIVYISHRMAEVHELADRVSVLRDGHFVGTLTRAELSADALVRMMVGRELSTFYVKHHQPPSGAQKVILSVSGIGDGHFVHDCSFEVREGEVLGLAGLVGAGRTELARLIFGADKRTAGKIVLNGVAIDPRSPDESIEAGIVYLTEDRKRLGMFLDMTVRENINIGVLHRDAHFAGALSTGAAARRSKEEIKSLAIRAASDSMLVGGLSGGNQQKVLLARLLETQPKVLFLDEPTRGIDIGAKSEIYRHIDKLAQQGIGVVVISSELPEVIGICDRVLVMRDGTIVGELPGRDGTKITQEAVIAIATGAKQQTAA